MEWSRSIILWTSVKCHPSNFFSFKKWQQWYQSFIIQRSFQNSLIALASPLKITFDLGDHTIMAFFICSMLTDLLTWNTWKSPMPHLGLLGVRNQSIMVFNSIFYYNSLQIMMKYSPAPDVLSQCFHSYMIFFQCHPGTTTKFQSLKNRIFNYFF